MPKIQINNTVRDMTPEEEEAYNVHLAKASAEEQANGYKRKRAREYPLIEDQLDDIYHNGVDAWKATIKVTKDKYPKP
mgnify:CR=1 FL=1|jgi:hypothetical protein